MQHVSLQAAATLTEQSVRTLRRRIADGSIKCADNHEDHYKTMICFDSIKPDICIALDPDDIELIKSADSEPQKHKMSWRWFFWKKTSLKVPSIGWNWRQNNSLPMPCTCWGVVIWKVTAYPKTIILPLCGLPKRLHWVIR